MIKRPHRSNICIFLKNEGYRGGAVINFIHNIHIWNFLDQVQNNKVNFASIFFLKLPHVYFRAFGRNSINLQLVILAVKWKKRSRLHRVSPPTINVNSKPVFMSPVLACRRRRRQFHWTWHISRTHIKPRNIFFNLTPCSVNRVQKYPLITHELRCVVAWCFAIVLHH